MSENPSPPEPPRSRQIGEQDGDEVLAPQVNDPMIQPKTVGGVLGDASIAGGRSLGGQVQSSVIAASFQNLEFENRELKAKLEEERKARHEAERKLSKNEGVESNRWQLVVLGGIVTVIGALLLSVGFTFNPAEGLEYDLALCILGLGLVCLGHFLPNLPRSRE